MSHADYYKNATHDRRASGHIFADEQEIGTTLACCHCGNNFLVRRGSGKRRGFCMECGSATCGRKECDVCVPFEKRLEAYEKGKIKRLTDEPTY